MKKVFLKILGKKKNKTKKKSKKGISYKGLLPYQMNQ